MLDCREVMRRSCLHAAPCSTAGTQNTMYLFLALCRYQGYAGLQEVITAHLRPDEPLLHVSAAIDFGSALTAGG